jgi:hypothetical protein
MIDSHKETRLNIIDEVSFAGYTQPLVEPQKAMECKRISIRESCHVFSGAFANLKLSTKTSFTSRSMEYIGNNLICLVELKGTHRYKNCPVLQRIMPKMRNEGLSADRKTFPKVIEQREHAKTGVVR